MKQCSESKQISEIMYVHGQELIAEEKNALS